jgi:hypothetical protein
MNTIKELWPYFLGVILFILFAAAASSCDEDCRRRGGVMVRTMWGGYECMKKMPLEGGSR